MNTAEKMARLKSLARKAGESLYERVVMAQEVLADKQWIAASHGDDYDAAYKCVEDECFPETALSFSLNKLLTILVEFPAKEDWKERGYDLHLLMAEYLNRRKKEEDEGAPPRHRQTFKVKEKEELDQKIKELEWDKKQGMLSLKTAETEVETLRREKARLERELAEERGQRMALERMIEQMRGQRVPA